MRAAVLAAAFALVLVSATLGANAPVVRVTGGYVVVTGLPAVLADEPVGRHLDTGLTTTFVIDVEVEGPRARTVGGAVLEVRYEPWEESYQVGVTDALGGPRRSTLADRAALEAWWQTVELQPLAAGPLAGLAAPSPVADVRLTVLPFSRAEQRDTQAWFERSLRRGTRGDESRAAGAGGAVAPGGPPVASGRDLSAMLLATSIGRRSLLVFTWRVSVAGLP